MFHWICSLFNDTDWAAQQALHRSCPGLKQVYGTTPFILQATDYCLLFGLVFLLLEQV